MRTLEEEQVVAITKISSDENEKSDNEMQTELLIDEENETDLDNSSNELFEKLNKEEE